MASVQQTLTCSNCSKEETNLNANFCNNCGTRYNKALIAKLNPPPAFPRSPHTKLSHTAKPPPPVLPRPAPKPKPNAPSKPSTVPAAVAPTTQKQTPNVVRNLQTKYNTAPPSPRPKPKHGRRPVSTPTAPSQNELEIPPGKDRASSLPDREPPPPPGTGEHQRLGYIAETRENGDGFDSPKVPRRSTSKNKDRNFPTDQSKDVTKKDTLPRVDSPKPPGKKSLPPPPPPKRTPSDKRPQDDGQSDSSHQSTPASTPNRTPNRTPENSLDRKPGRINSQLIRNIESTLTAAVAQDAPRGSPPPGRSPPPPPNRTSSGRGTPERALESSASDRRTPERTPSDRRPPERSASDIDSRPPVRTPSSDRRTPVRTPSSDRGTPVRTPASDRRMPVRTPSTSNRFRTDSESSEPTMIPINIDGDSLYREYFNEAEKDKTEKAEIYQRRISNEDRKLLAAPAPNIGGLTRHRMQTRQGSFRKTKRRPRSIGEENKCSRCLTSVAKSEIHVHFITILSPDFHFVEDRDKMFLRMAGAEYGNMSENTLEMRTTKSLKEKYLLFEGSRIFKADEVLDKVLPYMYLVVKDGTEQWETITNGGAIGAWQRCLQIHSAYYKTPGVWTQYDWPVEMDTKKRPNRSSVISQRSSTFRKKYGTDQDLAVATYLPHWEGFVVTKDGHYPGHTNAEVMEVSRAIDQAEQVWSCLEHAQLRTVGTGDTEPWTITGFDLQTSFLNFFADKFSSYKSKATIDINHDQLHSALAICYLVDQHSLPISDTQMNGLWDGLMLSPCSEDMCVTVLQSIRRQFGKFLKFALRSLENQCKIAIQKCYKTGDHRWMLALPLLHFLRGDIKPYAGVDIDPDADYSDPNCWGLSGLCANKRWILHADSSALSQMHKRIAHLCNSVEQDRLLPYAILWLLLTTRNQRRILVDFHDHLPRKHKVHPFMLLHALDTVMCSLSTVNLEPKSPSKNSSWDNKYLISDVGLLCNAMVSFLKSNKYIFMNIGEKFINMAISVAQSAIALSSLRQYELVTRSFTLINLCIASLEQGERAEQIYARIRLPVAELLAWLSMNLPEKFLDIKDRKTTVSVEHVEWIIWKELFKMTFPQVFEEGWKYGLLKLFQDRINALSNAAKIRIAQYNTGNSDLDQIIHQGAMDSMEKMLKTEKQDHGGSGLFRRKTPKPDELKSSDYDRVGDLMSELLKTTLPTDNQQQTEEDKWKTLEKILDWKPIVSVITMAGLDAKSILDQDANSGIAMVTRLITEMSQKILNSSIQLRQLDAIVCDPGRLKRFIEIYKTPAVNKKYNLGPDIGESRVTAGDMEKILLLRQKEFKSVEEMQPMTKNFVEMCNALAPAIIVDTGSIDQKALFDVKTSEHQLIQHCNTSTLRRKSIIASNNANNYTPVVKVVVPGSVMNVLPRLYDCNQKDSHVFRAICKEKVDLVSLKVEGETSRSAVYAAREIWLPVLNTWEGIVNGLEDEKITCDDLYSYFTDVSHSEVELKEELCKLSKSDRVPRWLGDRVRQIQDLFHLRSSLELAGILIELIEVLGLTQTRISDIGNLNDLATSGSQSLRAISTASKRSEVARELSSVDSAEIQCIKQVVHCQEVVKWIRNNMQDVTEFFDFINDIQSTELETDTQFDALTAFSRAVDGYAPLIFDLRPDTAALGDVMKACQAVWKNLHYDRNMSNVLRDSQRYLLMLQQFRQNGDIAQTTAMQEVEHINARGVYTLGTQPGDGGDYYCKPSLELFQLMVGKDAYDPDSHAITYEYEELRDLERNLTLMSSNITSKPEKQGQIDYYTDVLSLVHQTATIYKGLCTAGCMFFREWGAKLHCFHYHARPSIVAHFGTGKAISGSREIPRELADLRQFMEDCSTEWAKYVVELRSKYYHLNLYTNEQLLTIRQSLASLDVTGQLVPQVNALLEKVKTGCMPEDVDSAMAACQFSCEQGIAAALNKTLITQARQASSIKDTFEKLWVVYLTNLVEDDLGKALSLEQLGIFLAQLASQVPAVKRRTFTFREGKPNVIQCDNDDLLVTILSVYESDTNGNRLPGSEEVLLCDTETTVEEIDLLFRRAFDDTSGRIFCLGGPGILKGSVSSAALSCFNRLARENTESKYRLVIVCSNKRTVSPLLDAFRQYCVQPEKQSIRPKVKQFLEQQLLTAKGSSMSKRPVLVLSSTKPGTGKSLEVKDRARKIQAILIDNGDQNAKLSNICISLPIQSDKVDVHTVISAIWNRLPYGSRQQIFHFDISPLVRHGLDSFLFQLLILGEVTDTHGTTWRRRPEDQYIIEVTDLPINPRGSITKNRRFFSLLPCSTCYTPKEIYWQLHANEHQSQQTTTASPETFESAVRFLLDNPDIKYASNHLWRLDHNEDLEEYSFEQEQSTACQTLERAPCKAMEIIQTLLKFCGCDDPSWRVIENYATFITLQLRKCEASGLYQVRNLKQVGFKRFVVQFLARMAREFAAPSMKFLEQPESSRADDDGFVMYELLRTWNFSSHPYIFFNKEGEGTISYYGCTFLPEGTLVDSLTGVELQENMASSQLMHGLKWNGINFAGDDDHNVKELCKVLGVRPPKVPDTTFKLTPDNVKRILAIHTRLRFGLPVIIMGERGCGKTRLIRYLCKLLACDTRAENLMHVKIHGGTSASDINMCITKAEITEKLNRESYNVDTILFFDEANTTEAFDLIKEIILDGRLRGHPFDITKGSLKIIVSCTPYRRTGAKLIERVNAAGLGFNKFVLQRRQNQGPMPYGEMVYSVRPLPPSMLDFVWDFGTQDKKTEQEYILQIVISMVESGKLRVSPEEAAVVALILHFAHTYIAKKQQDECGLVVLKDVNRCLDVLAWFLNKMKYIDAAVIRLPTNQHTSTEQPMNPITKALVYSVAVCYHARLRESRDSFLEEITTFFNIKEPCRFSGGAQRLKREIYIVQAAFVNELQLPPTIAANATFKENVFMMVICIELRIPLFLIGKPGTSKSLAKTVVGDALEGATSNSPLFKKLKKVHFTTHQCNPKTTVKDINSAFEEAARVAKAYSPETAVSVVCLDELGLAEASPDAPLKILQPYLENVLEEEETEYYPPRTSCKDISFIGMSNWAVDIANMNAGIVLILDDPDQAALMQTAKELCTSSEVYMCLGEKCKLLPALARGFLTIMETQKSEYFGYPDFYNLIKMLVAFREKKTRGLTMSEVEHSIRRNFDHRGSNAQWEIFKSEMKNHDVILETDETSDMSEDPYSTDIGLVKSNVDMSPNLQGHTRHMLIETDNYAAISILQDHVLPDKNPVLFFRSNFRLDNTYSQMCRTVNRLKRCMENGRVVVLVNHADLFECLHDVLNLHYVSFAGQNYVELALGTNRVKCRIHKEFRLIVVANREMVATCFSPPLLGRFEKHFLAASSLLTTSQKFVVDRLNAWVLNFAASVRGGRKSSVDMKESIVGYHPDVIPYLVYKEGQRQMSTYISPDQDENDEVVFSNVQSSLIQCATETAQKTLRGDIPHGFSSLENFLWQRLQLHNDHGDLALVTTHSDQLQDGQLTQLEEALRLERGCIDLTNMRQFDTETQFRTFMRRYFSQSRPARNIYKILHCKDGHRKKDLIACATHYIQDERSLAKLKETRTHVILVIQMPEDVNMVKGFTGFPGGEWVSAHIPSLDVSRRWEGGTSKPTPPTGAKPKPPPPSGVAPKPAQHSPRVAPKTNRPRPPLPTPQKPRPKLTHTWKMGDVCPTSTETIGHQGGSITVADAKVVLKIPQAALVHPVSLSMSVDPCVEHPVLEKDQLILGPVVSCKPDGMLFLKPVTLSVPHSGYNLAPKCVQIWSKSGSGARSDVWEMIYDGSTGYAKDDTSVIVEGDRIKVRVLHFSLYDFVTAPIATITGWYRPGLILDMFAYMYPVDMATTGIGRLIVYAVKKEDVASRRMVKDTERKNMSAECCTQWCFVLKQNGNNLKVTVKNIRPAQKWLSEDRATKDILYAHIQVGGIGSRCEIKFRQNGDVEQADCFEGAFQTDQDGNTDSVDTIYFDDSTAKRNARMENPVALRNDRVNPQEPIKEENNNDNRGASARSALEEPIHCERVPEVITLFAPTDISCSRSGSSTLGDCGPFLKMVARTIEPRWKEVAQMLDFSGAQCDEFESAWSVSPWWPAYKMLLAWYTKMPQCEFRQLKIILADAVRPVDSRLAELIK